MLSPKERRRFYLLFGMMMISGLVEMITISVMFPFLAVVAQALDRRHQSDAGAHP